MMHRIVISRNWQSPFHEGKAPVRQAPGWHTETRCWEGNLPVIWCISSRLRLPCRCSGVVGYDLWKEQCFQAGSGVSRCRRLLPEETLPGEVSCSVWGGGCICFWEFWVAPKCILEKGWSYGLRPEEMTLDARWQALEWKGRITQNMAEIACFQKISIMRWLSADDAFGSKRCAICSYPKELADQRPADKTGLTVVLLEWRIV